MFGLTAIPAFPFFLITIFLPESVRWLVKSGRIAKADKILTRIGGHEYAKMELASIEETLKKEDQHHVEFKLLLEPKLVKILLLGIFLAVLQQWCGMNVVFYYAADIFAAAGFDMQQIMLNIVVIGSVMVGAVIVTMQLVERVGRKKLMLIGTGSMSIVYAITGYFFLIGVTGIPIVILTLANVALIFPYPRSHRLGNTG